MSGGFFSAFRTTDFNPRKPFTVEYDHLGFDFNIVFNWQWIINVLFLDMKARFWFYATSAIMAKVIRGANLGFAIIAFDCLNITNPFAPVGYARISKRTEIYLRHC